MPGAGFVQPSSRSPRSPESEITLWAAETYSTEGYVTILGQAGDGGKLSLCELFGIEFCALFGITAILERSAIATSHRFRMARETLARAQPIKNARVLKTRHKAVISR